MVACLALLFPHRASRRAQGANFPILTTEGIRKETAALCVFTQLDSYLCRDVLGTAEHNFVLKLVRIGCRHTQEDGPVLDRDSPLPRLEDLPQLSLWPR